MPVPEYFLWYFPAILLFNLVVVWYVIRRSSLDRDADDDSGGSGGIRCPECQAENDAWFQFCGSCLEELPKKKIHREARGGLARRSRS